MYHARASLVMGSSLALLLSITSERALPFMAAPAIGSNRSGDGSRWCTEQLFTAERQCGSTHGPLAGVVHNACMWLVQPCSPTLLLSDVKALLAVVTAASARQLAIRFDGMRRLLLTT